MNITTIYIILLVTGLISLLSYFKLKNKAIRLLSILTTTLIVVVSSVLSFKPLLDNINYGLDLQGGFEVLYQVSPIDKKDKINSDMLYNTYKSLLKRIDILGVSEPEITIEGEDRIRIKLAGVTNKEEAREVLSQTASLTFRDTSNHLLMTSEVLGGNAKVSSDEYGNPAVSLSIKDKDKFYDVTSKVSKMTNNTIVIWLDFEEGKDSFSKEKDKCGSLSNSHCLSAATVSQGFSSDVIIQGNFTIEEAKSLVELINSGALPTELEEISSRTVEASFGESSLNKTLIAGLIGIIIVFILMITVYHFSGLIAGIGLLVYTSLTFLVFYLIEGVLTLPGIAAMLLGIGMAVDANVIAFERVKDQLKIGKPLDLSFKLGNTESLTSIIDANITTLIVAIILFIFGESSVKGFATMLIINIIITVLVMVILVKVLLNLFVKTRIFDNRLNLFIGVSKKKIIEAKEIRVPFKNLEFVKNKKYFLTLTILMLVIGGIVSLTKGANLGVDFTGGTTITVTTIDNLNLKTLKEEIKDLKYTIKKEETSTDNVTITIDEVLENKEIENLSKQLEDKYNTNTDIYTVSKIVKQELTKNAIYSLVIASIGILIYIAIRFKFNYAIAAITALIHDSLMIILFFLITGLEINSLFIAAILTIIGYSINDTIVTFDMIRENYLKILNQKVKKHTNKKKKDKEEEINLTEEELIMVVNNSVRITFFRSILTTLTTILPVICLMILGAREIVNFNIALLVGFIAGVYSSIYISNQVWLMLEVKSIKKPKKDNKDDDEEINELEIKGVNC